MLIMKRIKILFTAIGSMLLLQNGMSQTNYYAPGKTFNNVNGVSGMTYICCEHMGGITLFNPQNTLISCGPQNKLTFVRQQKIDGSNMDSRRSDYYDMSPSMVSRVRNTVNQYLTSSEKARVKGEWLTVSLYLDSNTGCVKEVEFRFLGNSQYATIPPERYYQIEQALRRDFKVSMLPAGKELNYNLYFYPFEIRKIEEFYTIKQVLDNTQTESKPFTPTKTTGFLANYNYQINNKTIPDKLYEDVQLTKFTDNSSAARGKFFRKFQIGNYYLVAVTFGDLTNNRTDVLCVVNSAGTVLDKLEGWVTVGGATVKQYIIQGGNEGVYIYRVKTTDTRSFTDIAAPSFGGIRGSIETSFYGIDSNGKFFQSRAAYTYPEKLIFKQLTDMSKNVGDY